MRKIRSGFTLIELLVVIAIIAILIALLVPAVQKVREAANRTKCQNNLKQIAIGVHSYHDNNGKLPQNLNCNTYGTNNDGRSWSWLASILPYIDQTSVFDSGGLGSSPPPRFQDVAAVHAARISTYICPSDPGTKAARTDRANGNLPTGCTSYKGVSGSNWGWGTWQNTGPSGNNNGLDAGDGLFYRSDSNRKLIMSKITDGTSNTFMVGEDLGDRNQHCGWPRSNYATGTCSIPLNTNIPGSTPSYNYNDWGNVYSFRSMHPGGAHFAMADGSVRWVGQDIKLATYRAVATINGEEKVSLD